MSLTVTVDGELAFVRGVAGKKPATLERSDPRRESLLEAFIALEHAKAASPCPASKQRLADAIALVEEELDEEDDM